MKSWTVRQCGNCDGAELDQLIGLHDVISLRRVHHAMFVSINNLLGVPMATYLVTGVAGFIASKVAEFLLDDGHTVVGVDNLNEAYDVRLKHWRLEQIKDHPNFIFYQLDITDREALRALFEQRSVAGNSVNHRSSSPFEAIIHLAARAGVRQSVQNPWVYFETNCTGTLNLLELCKDFGISKFILASTSSIYGKENPMPYREDATTDHPLSPYAASKKAAEALCYTYHHLYGIDVTVFRYFTVYGPAGRPDMSLFRFVQWISEGRPVIVFGDGQQLRDFTYVDDIARGTIAGLKPMGYEIINLGSDAPVKLMDAIRLVEELVGKKAKLKFKPRHPADVQATWADIEKAKRLLDWHPRTLFEHGVHQLVRWYQSNEDWTRNIIT
ncbi:MAG: NAD-dependent epimerase [Patescibacteria group bacterium]|nr:MAG: NAD-dependent epimerase [Patescibacteria group bacterium]